VSDEVLRRLRREHQQSPDDPVARDRYMAELERVVGLRPRKAPRVELTDRTVPCLICEKPVELERYEGHEPTAVDIVKSNFDQGAHCRGVRCRTGGNYGCQVIDMDGWLHFVICDGCIVRHSAKMLYEAYRAVTDAEGKLVENDEPEHPGEWGRMVFKHEWLPVVNARDHFEEWFRGLKEKRDGNFDEYMKDISPHFED